MNIHVLRFSPLVLFALGNATGADLLRAQDVQGPLGLVVEFVRTDIQKIIPEEMKPYEPGPFFLAAQQESLSTAAREFLDAAEMESLGVTLVESEGMFVKAGQGNAIRDDGIFLAIQSVVRGENEGKPQQDSEETLTVTFSYFVTFQWKDGGSEICLMDWQLWLARPLGGATGARDGWRVANAVRRGMC